VIAIPTSQPRRSGLLKWLSFARVDYNDLHGVALRLETTKRKPVRFSVAVRTGEIMQFSHLHKETISERNSTSRKRQFVRLAVQGPSPQMKRPQ